MNRSSNLSIGLNMISIVSRAAKWAFYPLQNTAFRGAIYLALALFILTLTSIASLNTEKSRPGIDLSMNGSRVLIGLSIVTSNYGFNSPLYSYYKPVYDIFYTQKTHGWDEVNALIVKALAVKPETLSPDTLTMGFNELINDDKGIILWHAAAFAAFGPHLESIYLLYFALMATSMIIFWLAHRRDEAALILLPLYALAHMALAAFVLAGNPNVMGTLLTSRPFSMLAILPALHLALLMLRGRHFSLWLAAGAIYQIAFILLAVSVRSSAKTQVMLLLLLAAVLLLRWIWNHRHSLKINRAMLRLPFVWIIGLLVICTLTSNAFYAATVPLDIRNRSTAGHIVWHALLASFVLDKTGTLTDDLFGFAQSSLLFSKLHANKPKEMIGHDELAFYGVTGFYQSQFNKNIEPFTIVAPEHRDSRFLETCARQLFFHELHRRPKTILRLFVVEKSKELAAMTRDVMMTLHHKKKVALAFALGLLAGGVWLRSLKTVMPLLVTGLGVSLLPAYLFVPGTHIMYDYAPYFYMGFLSLATTVGALISVILLLALRFLLQKKPAVT